MDISRQEQRVLHLLAQGGTIRAHKDERGKIVAVNCVTRDGYVLDGFTLSLFKKLKRRDTVSSAGGGPYRITRRGLELVRSQLDNR